MSVKINAEKVRQMRKNLLWSQEDLAAGSGLSLRIIQRIEKNALASVDTLKAISAAFNVPADDLVLTFKFDGLRIGTIFGFSGAILGFGIGASAIIYNVMNGGMSGQEAGIWMGTLGLIAGLSCAFVGIIHYVVVRDLENAVYKLVRRANQKTAKLRHRRQ